MFRGLFEKATTPKKKYCEGETPKKIVNDVPTSVQEQQSGNGGSQTTPRNRSPLVDQVHTSPTSTIDTETSHGDESRSDATSSRNSDNANRNLEDGDSRPSSKLPLVVSHTRSPTTHPSVTQVQPTPPTNATTIDIPQDAWEMLVNKVTNMGNEMSQLKKDNVQLHKDNVQLRAENSQLHRMYDELHSKFDHLKNDSERITGLEGIVKQQEAWIKFVEQKLKLSGQAYNDSKEQISALQQQISALKKQISDLGKQSEQWQKESNQWQKSYVNQLGSILQFKQQVEDQNELKQGLANMKQEVGRLTRALQNWLTLIAQGELVQDVEEETLHSVYTNYDIPKNYTKLKHLDIHLAKDDNMQSILATAKVENPDFNLENIPVLTTKLQEVRKGRNDSCHKIFQGCRTEARDGLIRHVCASAPQLQVFLENSTRGFNDGSPTNAAACGPGFVFGRD